MAALETSLRLCLWFDDDAEEAMNFYVDLFPDSHIDAIVRYVVDPKQAGSVKSRLIAVMLQRLNAESERVRFPKGDNR